MPLAPRLVMLFALAAASLPSQSPPQAASSAPQLVRGRVVDPAGKPLSEVHILVSSPTRGEDPLTGDVLAAPTMKTGADGRFALPLREHAQLSFAAKGRASAHISPLGRADTSSFGVVTLAADGALDLHDLILPPAIEVHGRVLTADGAPLAEAILSATDAVAGPTEATTQLRGIVYRSTARSGADGRFALAGVFSDGLNITVRARGHATQRADVLDRSAPLTFTMTPTGVCRGKVADAEGRPLAATIYAQFQNGPERETVETDADGSFAVTLRHPGPFRLRAQAKSGEAAASEWLTALGEPLTLTVPPAAAREFRVRATDTEGRAIARFSASVQWGATDNPFMQIVGSLFPSVDAADGVAHLGRPGAGQPPQGRVIVAAPGFARTAVTATWDATQPECTVQLAAESSVAGKVVDADGKPLAGTRVRVAPPTAPPAGLPAGFKMPARPWTGRGEGELLTASDGSFRVGGLGAGKYEVTAWPRDLPGIPMEAIELAAGAHVADLTFTAARGATLRGKLAGPPPDVPAYVMVHAVTERAGLTVSGAGDSSDQRRVELAADRSFVVTGLDRGNHALSLALWAHPRALAPVVLPLGEVAVDSADLEQTLRPSVPLATTLRGKVTFDGVPVPPQRLLAVTQAKTGGPARLAGVGAVNWAAPARALLAADGSFALRAAPGPQRVAIYDLATGLKVGEPDDPVTVDAQVGDVTIAITLGKVVVHLQAPESGTATPSRLDVRAPIARNDPLARFAAIRDRDNGTGLPIAPGQTTLEFVAPVGDLDIFVRDEPGRYETDAAPLARQTVTVSKDKVVEVTLQLAARSGGK